MSINVACEARLADNTADPAKNSTKGRPLNRWRCFTQYALEPTYEGRNFISFSAMINGVSDRPLGAGIVCCIGCRESDGPIRHRTIRTMLVRREWTMLIFRATSTMTTDHRRWIHPIPRSLVLTVVTVITIKSYRTCLHSSSPPVMTSADPSNVLMSSDLYFMMTVSHIFW